MQMKKDIAHYRAMPAWLALRKYLMVFALGALASMQWAQAMSHEEKAWKMIEVMSTERFRYEKKFCEERAPEFTAQNEAAFLAYPYAKITAEEMIASAMSAEDRTEALTMLSEIRADLKKQYGSWGAARIKSFCSGYAAEIDQVTQKAARQSEK